MEENSSSPPSSKRAKLAVNSIGKLPDSLLEKMFSYLPFKDRHQLCLVSSKWAAASRIPWTDVTFLNLSSVPPAMVNAVLGLCPKIAKIEANGQNVLLERSSSLSVHENVRRLKLRNANFALVESSGHFEPHEHLKSEVFDEVAHLFGSHLGRFPSLAELFIQNVAGVILVRDDRSGKLVQKAQFPLTLLMPEAMAVSLRRLVLIDFHAYYGIKIGARGTTMPNLECLFLDGRNCMQNFRALELPQLRELCVHNRNSEDSAFGYLAGGVAAGQFPKLQVFMYSAHDQIVSERLAQLITADLPLRILAVAGSDDEVLVAGIFQECREQQGLAHAAQDGCLLTMPPRALSSGSILDCEPRKPCLQIFVGGDIAKFLRFKLPPSGVANFWCIDCPMPEYLSKPEVAEIFKDRFVAQVIREGSENGLKPWGHPNNMNLFYSTSPLRFC